MNLSAVILAGDESRRMGREKAWLELDGAPLSARALQTARRLQFDSHPRPLRRRTRGHVTRG